MLFGFPAAIQYMQRIDSEFGLLALIQFLKDRMSVAKWRVKLAMGQNP